MGHVTIRGEVRRASLGQLESAGIRLLALTIALFAAAISISSALAGGISDEPCPNAGGEHTNTCPSGTVGVPYLVRFVESDGSGCGPGRQTFHHDSGMLPPGFTLTPDGALSGVTDVPGTFRFYVEMREPLDDPEHCAGKRTQKQFTLVIRRQPWLVPTARPEAEVGVPFRLRLLARGGSGFFSWRLVKGRLPPGLAVGIDGSILGVPRVSGTYEFKLRGTDTESRTLAWTGSLVVAPRLRIPAQPLPKARVAQRFRADVRTTGGSGSVTWRLERGRLPRGIRFDARRGRFVGTARESGTFVVSLAATDELRITDTRALLLRVTGDVPSQRSTRARHSPGS
jgi:hypothetical protein